MTAQRIIITGASSGLGAAIARHLHDRELTDQTLREIVNWSLDKGVDVSSHNSVANAEIIIPPGPIDILVNCAGINGIDYLPDVAPSDFDRIMATNARGIFNTVQVLLKKGRLTGGTVCNIVSNAARIPMTSSLAYNASKAAALMMTKQLARELKKTHEVTVFSVSPNKIYGTGMSEYIDKQVCKLRGWGAAEARKYQLEALPSGEETDIETLAEFIAFLLSSKRRHKYLAGCDICYGGPTT